MFFQRKYNPKKMVEKAYKLFFILKHVQRNLFQTRSGAYQWMGCNLFDFEVGKKKMLIATALVQLIEFSVVCLHHQIKLSREIRSAHFNPMFAFHINTSQLICTLNQITDFYMKCSTGLKWVWRSRRFPILLNAYSTPCYYNTKHYVYYLLY